MTGPAEYDVCIVGAGPVGLALALRCQALGRSVVLLESGGLSPTTDGLPVTEIVDPSRHAPADIAASNALGGTSWWWGGRCVPFDPLDFAERPQAPGATWPIVPEDVQPWLSQAAEFLGCGRAVFEAKMETWGRQPGFEVHHLERWSTQPNMARLHRQALADADIAVKLNHRVVRLDLDPTGRRLTGLVAQTPDGPRRIEAGRYVLACGGLETTRLLLATQRRHPALFGGVGGPLGRFYMGHISGKIAKIEFTLASDAQAFDFQLDQDGAYRRRRFTLPVEVQIREGLLNVAFWPDNPPFHDPAHGSGTLSLVYLGLKIPAIGRRLLPEGVRRAHIGSGGIRTTDHVRNVARHPLRTLGEIVAIIRGRFLARPRTPGFMVKTTDGGYSLHYHAEHAPNADSRVTLDPDDAAELPGMSVDLRFGEADARSVLRAHELLDAALRASGKAGLVYDLEPEARLGGILAQASDGFHQIGTTRMGVDPAASVANADCRVHDLDNLFLASSSLFPSSGQANPTLLAVALALRLGDHLAGAPVIARSAA